MDRKDLNQLKKTVVWEKWGKKTGDIVYYFDGRGKLKICPKSKTYVLYGNGKLREQTWYKQVWYTDSRCDYPHLEKPEGVNKGILRHLIPWMKEGETLDDLYDRYMKMEKTHEFPHEQNIDFLVTRIERPIFIRGNSNSKKDTFDFIYVDILLTTQWQGDRRNYIKSNIKELKSMAVKKLEADRSFVKYGVPINFLKLERLTYSEKQNNIQLVFGLKGV